MNRIPSLLLLAVAACAPMPAPDSAAVDVAADWRVDTIHRGEAGVWYAHVANVVEDYAPPEVIAGDDDGRFFVFSVYSGNWTPHSCVPDGQWLAPSRPADVDPRIPGRELYAAGRGGSIHQVTLRGQPFAKFTLESREIGHVAGEEFHTVLAADLSPADGDELLCFAISGAVYQVSPATEGDGFVVTAVGGVEGRVRDAVTARLPGGTGATVLGVSRRGDLIAMQLSEGRLVPRVLLHENSGLGRIAASPSAGVFYVTRDDGVLLRVRIGGQGEVERQPILVTDQGLRGVAAGNFFADGREAVAVYGYGRKVQLVSRQPDDTWQVEHVYRGAQKGHWLTVGELDGRNATDELIATGFDGEIILLSRPAGYGMPGVAVPGTMAATMP